MNLLRTVFPYLLFSLLLCIQPVDVLAKRPASHPKNNPGADTQASISCLSNKQKLNLAKSALPELQLVDPNITLTEVKAIVNSAGECATEEEINTAIEQYIEQPSTAQNSAPTISGIPAATVSENELYYFTPQATDSENDLLTFSISNKPSWASFDTSSGTLSGTPVNTDIGYYGDITISVADEYSIVSLPVIGIDVFAAEIEPPVNPQLNQITGYSIFMGTSHDNISLETNVTIGSNLTNSKDILSTESYYFSIIAVDSNGNNFLTSDPGFAGYRIYAGTSSDSLFPVQELTSNPDAVYVLDTFPESGAYYMAVTTFDVNGYESPRSNIVQLTVM